MISKPVRWGIVGCGDVTEVKSGPAYQQIDDFELYAVMRRNIEKAKDYAERHNVPKYYGDARQLINDPEVDAVYIATPPDSHLEYALLVAEAGKPCCIEKPMAPNYSDCQKIVKAFEGKGLPLFVAYYRRSLPRFLKVKEWIDKGYIGKVRHINWQYTRFPSDIDISGVYNWRTDPEIAPGGYFDDLASHGIDLFEYLLGDIVDVKGFAVNQQGFYGAKDAITASWLHESGITGSGTWNFGSNEREDSVVIYGEFGTIDFAIFDEKLFSIQSRKLMETSDIKHPKHIQYYHVLAMRNVLFDGQQHPSTGHSGAHTSWVMDKILGTI